jgi:hypothetical protein
MELGDALLLVLNEVEKATKKFPPFNSSHEGFAILKEEVDELWDEVKLHDRNYSNMQMEAVQTAAMAIRFLIDMDKWDWPVTEQIKCNGWGDPGLGS